MHGRFLCVERPRSDYQHRIKHNAQFLDRSVVMRVESAYNTHCRLQSAICAGIGEEVKGKTHARDA